MLRMKLRLFWYCTACLCLKDDIQDDSVLDDTTDIVVEDTVADVETETYVI